jgi:predicted phage gp36 major capsid-like protein
MGRRAKPTKVRVEGKPSVARKSRKNETPRVRDQQTLTEILEQLQRRNRELTEALQREAEAVKREVESQEQQAATAEILRVMSSSPTEGQPVFEAIARNARRLLGGHTVSVARRVSGRPILSHRGRGS